MLGAALLLLASWLSVAVAEAHTRSTSLGLWTVEPRGMSASLRISELDLDALRAAVGEGEGVESRVVGGVTVLSEGVACEADRATVRGEVVERGWRRLSWHVRCPAEPDELRIDGLFEVIPRHVHFAVVRRGAERQHQVLSDGERQVSLRPRMPPTTWEVVTRYVGLGVVHILGGWDHLLFVGVLLLGARERRGLLVAISGFTLGHSLSLGAAALGLVVFEQQVVEAFIGASIALLAVEVAAARGLVTPRSGVGAVVALVGLAAVAAVTRPQLAACLGGLAIFVGCYLPLAARAERPEVLRAVVVTLFGVGHGLGFASALAEVGTGTGHVVTAVLGFNGGVEVGQLAVVAAAWPALAWARRQRWWEDARVLRPALAGAALVGVALAVGRAFG